MAKTCQDYGQRVQNSVFECLVAPAQKVVLIERLVSVIDGTQDSLPREGLQGPHRELWEEDKLRGGGRADHLTGGLIVACEGEVINN